jgi:tetratricopeptide (TPR) repeat protein
MALPPAETAPSNAMAPAATARTAAVAVANAPQKAAVPSERRQVQAQPAFASKESAVVSKEPEVNPEIADAERALEAMTNFRLAETALQRGDMPQAEKLAQKAAEGDPEQGEYRALLAWIKAMGATPNQVSQAIEMISGVLKEDATCERALLYRGKLYKRANKTKEALKDFEALLKINSKHREAASEVRLLKMHTK